MPGPEVQITHMPVPDEPDTTSMSSSPSDTDHNALDAMTQKVYFQLIIYLKTENNQNHQLFKGILLL